MNALKKTDIQLNDFSSSLSSQTTEEFLSYINKSRDDVQSKLKNPADGQTDDGRKVIKDSDAKTDFVIENNTVSEVIFHLSRPADISALSKKGGSKINQHLFMVKNQEYTFSLNNADKTLTVTSKK